MLATQVEYKTTKAGGVAFHQLLREYGVAGWKSGWNEMPPTQTRELWERLPPVVGVFLNAGTLRLILQHIRLNRHALTQVEYITI